MPIMPMDGVPHAAGILLMALRFAFRESACMVAQRQRGVAGNRQQRQRIMPGMPKKWPVAMIMLIGVAAAGGCTTLRAIDQWKCDKLGWCCFGTRPSAPTVGVPPVFAPTAECPPGVGSGPAGCCPVPGSGPPVTITTPGALATPPAVSPPGTVIGPGVSTVPGPLPPSGSSPSPSGSTAPGTTPPPVLPGP